MWVVFFFFLLFSEFDKLFNRNMRYCLSLEKVIFRKEGLIFPGMHTVIFPSFFKPFFPLQVPYLYQLLLKLVDGVEGVQGPGGSVQAAYSERFRTKSDATPSSLPSGFG